MVISRMYSEKCGYRDGVARIVTISGGGCRKLMDPVWCSEKVLNPEMRGDPSSDSEYRTGFVWNPGRRAKICSISALVLYFSRVCTFLLLFIMHFGATFIPRGLLLV